MAYAARPAFGASDLVYALQNAGTDIVGGAATYGAVKSLAGLGKISVNPNPSIAKLAGDDNAGQHVLASIGKIDVQVELNDIEPSAEAEIFGHTYAAGSIVKGQNDQPPRLALGYKVRHTGSSVFSYVWLLSGVFLPPDEANDTKGESVTLRRKALKAEFFPLVSTGAWEHKLRTDDANAAAALITGFFSTVVQSGGADLGALTLTSGAGVASTRTMVLTFAKAGGGTAAIANATALNVYAIIDSSKALLVPTTFTPSAAGVAPTLTIVFSALTVVTHTVFVTADLKDNSGVSCVAKAIAVTPSA